jgi:putative DNA primase/helicase
LTLDGSKARVAAHRLTFGTLGTGAIRLGQCDDVLGIAEGMETALAATQLAGVPCWSSVGAARLHAITVPDSIRIVHVFGDNDPTGKVAAEKAAERHTREGRKVHLRFPPKNWNDYNDVLIARAKKVAA